MIYNFSGNKISTFKYKFNFKIANMQKDKVVEMVNQLPAEFELDDLFEKLIFIEQIEKARKQIENGQFKTQEEVEQMIKSW